MPQIAGPGQRRAAASLLLLAALLAGCAQASTAPETTENTMTPAIESPAQSAAIQGRLEQLLPPLQESSAQAGVDMEIINLRETSCLRPEIQEQNQQTSWEGVLHGTPADTTAANAALDQISAFLQAEGWALTDESSKPDEEVGTIRLLYFEQDGLHITARHDLAGEADLPSTLQVLAASGCVDHPEDHQMLRSPLDPDYGKSHPNYTDGD